MRSSLNFLLGLDTLPAVILLAVVFIIIGFVIRQRNTINYPSNLPRVREDGRTSFSLKTRLAYYNDCQALFLETYDTYSKRGKTCLIPGLGFRDEVILPHSSLRWAASQPDTVLSVYENFVEMDQAHYSVGGEQYVRDPWQGGLVRSEMNAVLENLCAALNEELGVAFEQRLGTEKEWREVGLLELMRGVVAQGSSRFTVGLPLCRNEEYLEANLAFVDRFIIIAALIGAMPKFLRPVTGSLIWPLQRSSIQIIKKHFKPLFEARLQLCRDTEKDSPKEPQDHLQMMIRYGLSKKPLEVIDFANMTSRLALSNLGSFHQTSIAVTNVILNILDSDKEYNTIATLRQEISEVIGVKKIWTKAAVAKLVKCDSVCRETLRLHSFGNRSMMRKVMVDVTTPDGITLPKGSLVSILLTSQVDGDYFPEPLKFKPFRFSDIREKEDDKMGVNFVSLGDKFLPFSYGRHACPGRFLLDFELKMILSYLLVDYDIELAPEHNGLRPPSKWAAEAIMPPSGAKIRVRRRTG